MCTKLYFLIVCRKLCPSRFRYYIPLAVTLCLVMPAVVPWYFWDESFQTAFFVSSMFRYVLTLHATWLTNSAAHIWGYHPYDKWVALSLAVAYFMYIVVHTLWFNVENVCLLFKCVFCREIKPSDSRLAAIFSLGEWHNYHHVFPGDYTVAELGSPRMT